MPTGIWMISFMIWGAGTELQPFCSATSLDVDVQREAGARGTELCATPRLPKLPEPLANFSRD